MHTPERLIRVLGAIATLVGTPSPPAHGQAPPGSNLQVFLMTMGPGADIYERFGHNAIWIRDTLAHTDLIYNYGMFEFPAGLGEKLAFYWRFAMGRPRYWLGVDSSLQHMLDVYRYYERDVSAQALNLTPAQRAGLASRLSVNALPQNRVYTYDYFRDNCSTRVRDMLDVVLGGALKRATRDRPGAGSLRFHTLRSITNDKLMFLGIDAAFGPRVDRRIDRWDEMFLPEKVQQRVGELHVPDGGGAQQPLVKAEFPLLTIGRYHVDPAPPHWLGRQILIAGLIAGIMLLAMFNGVAGVVGRVVMTAWFLLLGLGGMLLLFFWLGTAQVATYANHNLLFFSPLALGLLRLVWAHDPASASRWNARLVGLMSAGVVLGFGLIAAPIVTPQDNLPIAVLAGVPTLAAAWVLARKLRTSNLMAGWGGGDGPRAASRAP